MKGFIRVIKNETETNIFNVDSIKTLKSHDNISKYISIIFNDNISFAMRLLDHKGEMLLDKDTLNSINYKIESIKNDIINFILTNESNNLYLNIRLPELAIDLINDVEYNSVLSNICCIRKLHMEDN